uniref:Uncharacterized protein n=1 Tax=Photinus pyralis TaxID=7054 RepID=A0A1Y1L0U8_PHOPY
MSLDHLIHSLLLMRCLSFKPMKMSIDISYKMPAKREEKPKRKTPKNKAPAKKLVVKAKQRRTCSSCSCSECCMYSTRCSSCAANDSTSSQFFRQCISYGFRLPD